ncbi:MAG: M28 family peptidase, partial [Bacteroidota bacterium]
MIPAMSRLGACVLVSVLALAGCSHSPVPPATEADGVVATPPDAPAPDTPASDAPAPETPPSPPRDLTLPTPLLPSFSAIDTTQMRAHIAELASDRYEGRGTGTPGEAMTVAYIIRELQRVGMVGGMPDGSFTQPVPLRSVQTLRADGLRFTPEAGDPIPLTYGPDLIGVPDDIREALFFDGAPMVFVGYGITNPGYDWDDYDDVDVRGKVLVSFVNDPPATASEPTLFQADTLTYNGRWMYKYEEARRRGALAMLLIHTTETAGYPFSVLNLDPYGERYTGVEPPEGALGLAGWISESVARRLAQASGMSLEDWFRLAGSRAFRPIDLPVTFSASMDFAQEPGVTGTNVVAKMPGQTPESVVYTAHHDHLGVDAEREARGEDGIYNGAVDNASGVAM